MSIISFKVAFSSIYIFLPVFHELKVTSSFQYLEKRYDKRVRIMASSFFIFGCILFVPVVVYVPALAFSQGE